MDIVLAGAHGQVARLLIPRLVARGDRVRGILRNPDHRDDTEADGAEAVVCDLETAGAAEIEGVVTGAHAIVFAAGAGPGSSAERKWTVDHGAALKLVDAAAHHGIRRYVMLSSQGTDEPPQDDAVFSVYLRAKAQADADLRAAGLDHTIVRPTALTDEPGQGTVQVARRLERSKVSRDDVAAVLAAVLPDERTYQRTFEVAAGATPVGDVAALLAQQRPDA